MPLHSVAQSAIVVYMMNTKHNPMTGDQKQMSHLDQAAALATVDKTPEQLEAELWMQKRRSLRATTKRFLLLSKLADGLSTESIERIATAMPHILAEAVNELDGKVEYVMVTK